MKQNKSENRNLWLFFFIAFVFSWLFWIPQALIAQGLLSAPSILVNFLNSPFNPAAFGPLVAAFYLTYRSSGKMGVIELLKRGIGVKFSKVWFIPILLLMPAVTGGALLISKLLGGITPDLTVLYSPWLIVYWFFYMLFLGGPLQEEFGWRGYALDRLQLRHTAFTSSVILGFMWAVWHFPLNFASGTGPQYSQALPLFIGSAITIILLSILFTWIYNNTGRSIFATLLFHASLNLSTFKLFPVFESQSAVPYYSLLIFISVITILIIWGPKRMVREKPVKTTLSNGG